MSKPEELASKRNIHNENFLVLKNLIFRHIKITKITNIIHTNIMLKPYAAYSSNEFPSNRIRKQIQKLYITFPSSSSTCSTALEVDYCANIYRRHFVTILYRLIRWSFPDWVQCEHWRISLDYWKPIPNRSML